MITYIIAYEQFNWLSSGVQGTNSVSPKSNPIDVLGNNWSIRESEHSSPGSDKGFLKPRYFKNLTKASLKFFEAMWSGQ